MLRVNLRTAVLSFCAASKDSRYEGSERDAKQVLDVVLPKHAHPFRNAKGVLARDIKGGPTAFDTLDLSYGYNAGKQDICINYFADGCIEVRDTINNCQTDHKYDPNKGTISKRVSSIGKKGAVSQGDLELTSESTKSSTVREMEPYIKAHEMASKTFRHTPNAEKPMGSFKFGILLLGDRLRSIPNVPATTLSHP